MLPLLADHDFNHQILRGLQRRIPNLDVVAAHRVDLGRATDPDLLAWAAVVGRAVVTHDRKTMPRHAFDRLKNGEPLSGLIVASQRLPVAEVIRDLEIIVTCSDAADWKNVIRYLPL